MSKEPYWEPCFSGEHYKYVKWEKSLIDEDGIFYHYECKVCRYGLSKQRFIDALIRSMRAEYSFHWSRGKADDEFALKNTLLLFRNSFSRSVFLECYEKAKEEFSRSFIVSWERNLRSSVSRQQQ